MTDQATTRIRHSLLPLAALTLACLAATACSGGSGAAGTGPSAAGTATTGTGAGTGSGTDPLAGLTAKQVAGKAIANLRAATSFTIAGSMSGGLTGGSGLTGLDLSYLRGKGCSGTIAEGAGHLTLVVIGSTAWLKGDDAFWRATSGAAASTIISVLNGRYLKLPLSNPDVAQMGKICDVGQLTSSFTPPDIAKGTVTTLNGVRVLPLTDKAKGGVLYVTDTASPQFVELDGVRNGAKGKLTFSIGAPVTLTAPPASQTLDASTLGI